MYDTRSLQILQVKKLKFLSFFQKIVYTVSSKETEDVYKRQEEDTPAFSYPDQVPEEVKEERRDEIMELQQDIAFEHCENMVGRVLTVLIEGKVVDEPAYVGRTYMDAPNVDGLIFVNGDVELMSGDFVRVKVTGAAEYDLIGEVYDESARCV